MKKIIYFLLLLPIVAIGQSHNQNYTKVTTYKEAYTSPFPHSPILSSSQALVEVVYYDGLGRPIQQISNKQSATGKNIVTHIAYDQYGRQVTEYLPFKSETEGLEIETDALDKTLLYPQYLNQYPYSEKLLEASPLNRVLKQSAPGESWKLGNGHEVKFDYQTNDGNEVKFYKAAATYYSSLGLYNIALINSTGTVYYDPNTLYKTITFDENNLTTSANKTTEFKDTEGRVILKRVNTTSEVFDTYYVYDQFGNLTYVMPPLVNTNNVISQTILDGLCYQYKYDSRNRLVEKKLPGKQWEFIVYNKVDLPVATGPVNNINGDTKQGWLITKYDAFNRPILTGWFNGVPATAAGRLSLQTTMNGQTVYESKITSTTSINGLNVSYTDTVYPSFSIDPYTLLTVNYYDDYAYAGAPIASSIPTTIEGQTVSQTLKGLPTGSWVRALQSGTITGELSYMLYDFKGKVIRSNKTNHLGGFTQVDTKFDFIGKTNYTVTMHKKSNSSTLLKVKDAYTYTLQDRLESHTHQINDGVIQLLTKNEYDDLGQLISKRVGGTDVSGTSALQKVDYDYNIRGWLKSINNVENLSQGTYPQDLFSFALSYDTVPYGSYNSTLLFNGNISESYWKTSSDNVLRKYSYQYDELNRLKNAFYKKPNLSTPDTNSYNESVTYDKNGNILSLQRTGGYDDAVYNLTIDNLTYTYNTDKNNQLMKVSDASLNPNGFKDGINNGDDYSYDANGNMKEDKNKDIIGINYNHLNLPVFIYFGNGNKIEYLYNALGTKLSKTVFAAGVYTVTDYLDGFQYANNVLEFFPHAEGYVKNTMVGDLKNFNYVFNYTDHLGNVRLSYGLDGANGVKILEENNYYPFGLSHKNYNTDQRTYNKNGLGNVTICSTCPTGYKYKYNGKEFQDELGLNLYDYDNRQYDPATSRFLQIDPLAENGRRWSPYNYCFDNPIYFQDPDGMWPWPTWSQVKSFAVGTYNGAKGYVKNALNTISSAPSRLAKGYSSPKEALKLAVESHPISMVVGQFENTANGVNSLIKGDYKEAGKAYGNQLAAGVTILATDGAVKSMPKGKGSSKPTISETTTADSKPGSYAPKEPLRRAENGEPAVDAEAIGRAHTQLGTTEGRNGSYTQAREFNESGKPVRDIDFTDHGRPQNHPNPHQHDYIENETGGTLKRSKEAKPLTID